MGSYSPCNFMKVLEFENQSSRGFKMLEFWERYLNVLELENHFSKCFKVFLIVLEMTSKIHQIWQYYP